MDILYIYKMKKLYIYKITNTINGKVYVGKHSSYSLENNYFGSGIAIKKAIKKYGKKNFKKEIICECINEENQNEMEVFWIEKENSFKNGYNMTLGGEGMLGYKPAKDSIIKGSESRRMFYVNNPEARKNLSEKGKLRIGNLNNFFGKKLTIEHIDKMRKARVNAITGKNNPSAVRIRCIETNDIFDTVKDAAEYCGLKYSTSILKSAKGQAKSAGGFTWEIIPK